MKHAAPAPTSLTPGSVFSSGHGTQTQDLDGDEDDGFDEGEGDETWDLAFDSR
jgi:hypothetical protein